MNNDLLVQQALTDLDSADPVQRIDALHRLRPHKDSQIAPKVIPLLRDDNAMIRRLAAEVLGRNGDKGVVTALIKVLYDPDADVREAAADALGLIGDQSAVPALTDLLYDEDTNVRFAATEALGILGDPRSVVDLIRILDSDDIPLSVMAAMALHKIGTPEALAAIQHLWNGDHYNFEGSTNSDVTLPHIPVPRDRPSAKPSAEPASEAQELHQQSPPPSASASAPDNDLEETVRSIPHDLFQSYLEDDEDEEPEAERGLSDALKEAEAPAVETAAEPVQFSAYTPREMMPNSWQPLRAYVFKQSAANAVSADAKQELGDKFGDYRQVERPATTSIAEGALITATPELNGFQFNPPSAQAVFYDAFERFDFKLRATTNAPLDQASNGRITFSVEGVIVADVPLSIYVSETIPAHTTVATVPVTRPLYQAIFCSYSRQDSQIVEHIERAYKALGLDFLRDVETLKAGQDWAAELPRLIERADIFQLFWSQAAAQSAAVRKEWTFALSLKRQNNAFIRPVYWQQPMPPPPPELGAINFAYQPDLDK
jgi:hypothetical protein